ncbi:MAG: hypothetical protein PUC59_02445 [Firmicutes bacterium]|nr:hypothetical protein [Bacillota bacterium]
MVIWIGTEMRQEILAIHTEVDACNGIQRKLKTLKKEKEDPAPPTVSLKPENTGDKLKRAFEQQNQARLSDDRRPEIIVKVINIVLQVLICGLLALDVFVHTGLVLGGGQIALLEEFNQGGPAAFFVFQVLISLEAALVPCLWSELEYAEGKWKVILVILTIFNLYCYVVLSAIGRAMIFPALAVGSLALAAAAIGIAKLVRMIKVKSPSLTHKQKEQWKEACLADEKAREENRQSRAEAKKQWEADRAHRLPEIDREIQKNVREFKTRRQRIDEHMKKLGEMDALCEDDKNLQVVDMLIRFIRTRRADSIKEALQEYDKLKVNQQMLEIEKQKLAAEIQRTAQEHADRMQKLEEEKKHQAEMEYLARDSARSRAEEVRQLENISHMIYYNLHG